MFWIWKLLTGINLGATIELNGSRFSGARTAVSPSNNHFPLNHMKLVVGWFLMARFQPIWKVRTPALLHGWSSNSKTKIFEWIYLKFFAYLLELTNRFMEEKSINNACMWSKKKDGIVSYICLEVKKCASLWLYWCIWFHLFLVPIGFGPPTVYPGWVTWLGWLSRWVLASLA